MRVLLVDDNAMNIELFADSLESDGHEIVVEHDGPSGRERGMSSGFDAYLTKPISSAELRASVRRFGSAA